MYSEKSTKFRKIFLLLLTVCTVVKSKGKISQNFVAFSEYMNFNSGTYAKDLFIFLHGLSQVVLFLYVSFSQFNDIFKENIFYKDLDNFRHRKLTLKVRILQTADDDFKSLSPEPSIQICSAMSEI